MLGVSREWELFRKATARVQMSEASSDANEVVAASRSRQWLVAVFFICWTLLAAVAVWWLISDAAKSGDTVIRVNAGKPRPGMFACTRQWQWRV